MLKKTKVIPLSKSSINLKCGDCLHFALNAKFEKPCSELGVKRFTEAPNCFSPNVYLLGKKNPDQLYQLGLILKDFSAQESRVFFSLLKQANQFEKHYGLKFGQPVYFCIGADYLSNYFSGYVIGVAECGDSQVFIGSDLQKKQRGKPLTGSFLRESVFTVSEFKKKREQLQKQGRLQDPNPLFTKPKAQLMKEVDYTPPSMDTVPPEWFTKEDKKGKVKKGKGDARISSKSLKKSIDGTLQFKVNR
jgi:hypothetical protein